MIAQYVLIFAITPKSHLLLQHCYWAKLGSSWPSRVKPIYWHWLVKVPIYCKGARLLQGTIGVQAASVLQTQTDGFQGNVREEQGAVGCMVSSWTFFSLADGEAIRSQHHQPVSNPSGVCLLVGSKQLTSCIGWQCQYLQSSSKDMAQNIIHILEELPVLV